MAKKADNEPKPAPPSSGFAFLIGIMLFGAILCPAGVLISYSIKLNHKLGIIMMQSLSIGCLVGLVIAVIPAIIFMRFTMKRIKRR